jgi:hypothetical protein
VKTQELENFIVDFRTSFRRLLKNHYRWGLELKLSLGLEPRFLARRCKIISNNYWPHVNCPQSSPYLRLSDTERAEFSKPADLGERRRAWAPPLRLALQEKRETVRKLEQCHTVIPYRSTGIERKYLRIPYTRLRAVVLS